MSFQILWAPWRSKYIKSLTKHEGKDACLFCILPKKPDSESLIVYRGRNVYVVLNAFPYTSGHVMVVPYKHVDSLEKLSDAELLELFKTVNLSLKVLREAFKPEGFNIGINLGRPAGAGVEKHVHVHIVPRWTGDANFMTTIYNTRVLPISLEETYKLLKEYFKRYEEALDL